MANDQPRLTQREFVGLIAEAPGRPVPVNGLGRTMLAIGGLFIPGAREMVEMMYEFEQPFVVDSSQFERAFGVAATPVREALQRTIAWYQAHPKA